jgi:glycerol-3-phosphate acyltransferase PlsX
VGNGPRIAIDAMGGDVGPAVMLAGAARLRGATISPSSCSATRRRSAPELARRPGLSRRREIVHCPDVISGEDRPSQAIRRAKTTSMGRAIAAVKEGRADAAVSGGNTGALMAMSKLALRTMPGIDRPALAACCRRSAPTTSSCSISAPIPNATPATSSSSR